MPEVWKPKDHDTLVSWLQAIQAEALDKLNKWEIDFIINIDYKLQRFHLLTEAQEKTLEKIYAKYTS